MVETAEDVRHTLRERQLTHIERGVNDSGGIQRGKFLHAGEFLAPIGEFRIHKRGAHPLRRTRAAE